MKVQGRDCTLSMTEKVKNYLPFCTKVWAYNFPMMIQGKSCTLTVARDGYYYPLPYSEDTVRLTSKDYVLPEYIGKRNKEKTVITNKRIEGCFITRLDYSVVQCLFLLFFL